MSTTGDPGLHAGLPGETARWLRNERTISRIRWATVVFAVVQVLTYYRPHPPGLLAAALGVTVLLAVGNAGVALALRRTSDLAAVRRLALASLTLDGTAILAYVAVYTFDPDTAIWALIYLLPLEAAVRFGLRGAMITTAVATLVYSLREVVGTAVYGHDLLLQSISFRMGIAFIIAAVAGSMATRLLRERDEVDRARAAAEHAAGELAAANEELATLNSELREVARLKDDFLAMTNHELRTPLTAVVGYASLLATRWDALPDDRRREFAGVLHRQAGRLEELVEDLLTLSSLRAGALALRTAQVDVARAVADAIEGLAPPAPPVEGRCPPGLSMRADRQRLVQILTNFLSNAVKYGAPPITVDAHEEDGSVVVRVRDRGPGVAIDFVPQLFDTFTRGERPPDDTTSGTGLGLAIARLLARAQGGAAWYESEPAGGACFCVRLPSWEAGP